MAEANACTKNLSNQWQRPPQRRRRRFGGSYMFVEALLSAALATSLGPTSCALANETPNIKANAYYYPHTYYERNGLGRPENIDFTKISRVNYGSFQIDESGSIWGTDLNADAQILHGPINWNPPSNAKKYCHFASPANIPTCQYHDIEKGLIRAAHSVGTRVYATIGGPNFSEPFSSMAADLESREKFAKRCVQILNTYKFDGIDIDWRFPGSALDMANYSLLLAHIRDELDRLGSEHGNTFGLTATFQCVSDESLSVDIFYLNSIIDEFNLLTNDFHGPWEDKVGASAPLYDQIDEIGLSVDSCVHSFTDGGASREKINIAVPFYGRSFSGAFAIGQECKASWSGDCSDTLTWQEDAGSPKYFSIYKKLSQLNVIFDKETVSTFAFSDTGIVSFDDERTVCLKTQYVIENELGGVLILELGGDLLEEFSTPLLDAMNLKLLNNELSCDSNAFMESLLRQENIAHEGREEPIPESNFDDKETSPVEFLYSSEETQQEYRYTCGYGEGDARKKCSRLGWQEGWEEIPCSSGTCPEGQLCFVSLCDIIPEKKIEDVLLESSASFSKSAPKSKPKRKPLHSSMAAASEALSSHTDMPLGNDLMSFSCGVTFNQAESCGQLCPNGLVDCPPGEFCFWLECKNSLPTVPTPSMTSAPAPQIKFQQYKCGSTRDEALMCGEDCGNSWQCPDGKDCYLVQCPL